MSDVNPLKSIKFSKYFIFLPSLFPNLIYVKWGARVMEDESVGVGVKWHYLWDAGLVLASVATLQAFSNAGTKPIEFFTVCTDHGPVAGVISQKPKRPLDALEPLSPEFSFSLGEPAHASIKETSPVTLESVPCLRP